MPQNGKTGMAQAPPPIFTKIEIDHQDGADVYEYAQHTFQFNPSGGGMLVVQETKGEQRTAIYTMDHFKRVLLTPTKLSLV